MKGVRAWKLPDGNVLVEGDAHDAGVYGHSFFTPSGSVLERAHTYWVIDASGAIVGEHGPSGGSVQEHLYASAFLVVGNDLIEYFCDWNTDVDDHSATESIARSALVPLDSAPDIRSAIAAYRKKRAEEQERWAREMQDERENRKRTFTSALPKEPADFIFEYEDLATSTIVVRLKDGPVLYRERCTGFGRDLFRELQSILRDHYGSVSFDANLPTAAEQMAYYDD
jgi:hypothetical protein